MPNSKTRILLLRNFPIQSSLFNILKNRLTGEITVEDVQSEPDAIFHLKSGKIDMVFLEENFGEGLDSLYSIRKSHSELPVIFVQDQADEKTEKQVLFAGAADCLSKEDICYPLVWRTIQLVRKANLTSSDTAFDTKKFSSVARMATLGVGASSIAHEVNNRLSVVLGNAGSLQQMVYRALSGAPEAETVELEVKLLSKRIETILNSTTQIGKIIKSIRKLSRSEDSSEPMEKIELGKLIEEVFELCDPKAKSDGVKLMLEPFPEKLQVLCHSTQIAQVLINLVFNAIDAAKDRDEKWVKIVVRPQETWIDFRINDSGQGVAKNDLKNLWQPFFTTKEKDEGTGLGLAVSKDIITRHKGELFVDEEEPHTCFVARLKLEDLA